MTLAFGLLLLAFQSVNAQAGATAPDILVLAGSRDEPTLRREVARRPDDAREALAAILRLSVEASHPDDRMEQWDQAAFLAHVYERAWSDAFLTRSVDQFRRWSTQERRQKVEADSLRRTAAESFYREGPATAIGLWQRCLAQYRALGDVAGEAATLANIGAGYYALGKLDQALRTLRVSLALAEDAADRRTVGNILGNIGNAYKDLDELTEAADYYRRALEVRPLTGDRRGEAADLNNSGLVRQALGDLAGAAASFTRALQLNRSDGRDGPAADNLTNLANLATLRGEYEPALALYQEALALRRRRGDVLGEALDLQNLGLLHMRWGDYSEALTDLQDALALLSRTGPHWRRAEVHRDLAAVHAATGDLQGALEALDAAEKSAGDQPSLAPRLALLRADLLTELNDLELAVAFYRQASVGFEKLSDPVGTAEAARGLGYLHLARGDYEAAETSFARALAVQEGLDDPRPAALTRVMLGDALHGRGDIGGARRAYDLALSAHRALGDSVGEAVALGALADLDREIGSVAPAEGLYRRALARIEGSPVPSIRSHLEFGLGLTLRERGRSEDAVAALKRSIAASETVGATLPVEEQRYGFLADKWGAYAELAKTEVDLGRSEAAFETSERMRARQLVDLLARGRPSARGDRALVAREQYLRRRIGELTAALERPAAGPSSLRGPSRPGASTQEREALAQARSEYERLLVRLKGSSPDYADLVTGSVASVTQIRQLLPANATLVEYLVAEDWTIAFVVSRDTVAALSLPIQRATIRQLVRFFRGTVQPKSHDDEELWRSPLRRLYMELVAPIEDGGYTGGRELLVIAPHAELHYLPFQALLKPTATAESFLIESYDVSYVPSATAWTRLSRRSSGGAKRTLAMAPRPDVLSHSVDEVRAIEKLRPGADVFLGAPATEARFAKLAPEREIIHLATFGVLNRGNPLFSYVRLNPGGGADGRLEVHEVFGLALDADLVVLSACETGLGTGLWQDVPPGDDWVGLVRAFLHAGAGSVLASLWPVDDRATARLMARFYEALDSGHSTAAALAAAQRFLLREYENPFFWAAFELNGGGGV